MIDEVRQQALPESDIDEIILSECVLRSHMAIDAMIRCSVGIVVHLGSLWARQNMRARPPETSGWVLRLCVRRGVLP